MEAGMVNRNLSKAAAVNDGTLPKRRPSNAGLSVSAQPSVTPVTADLGARPLANAPQKGRGMGDVGPPPQIGLGPDLQAVIGQQLRMVYHEVLNEQIPDRFVRLLEELAKKEESGQ
jgi:hypothetical protein